MKNNFLKFLFIYLLLISSSLADQFIFKTSKVEIVENGNLIIAKDGEAISNDGNLVIDAQEFEYNKSLDILDAYNGTAHLKLENLKIEFGKITADQKILLSQQKIMLKLQISIKK